MPATSRALEYSSRVRRSRQPRAFLPFNQVPPVITQTSGPLKAPAPIIPKYGSEFEEPPLPAIEPTPIPNVGQFGTTGTLPTNPGPPDPLPSGNRGIVPADYWTRLDPNLGYIAPTVQIDPSQGSGLYPVDQPGLDPANDPPTLSNTRSTDRTFGQRLLGNRLINPFARRNETWRENAGGTRVRGNAGQPGGSFPSGAPGASSLPWYHPNYIPPAGIRDAIARGDYERAYGPSERSIANAKIAASQAYGGNPNATGSFASEGRFLTDEEGAPTQMGPRYANPSQQGMFRGTQAGPVPYASNTNERNRWLMAQPEYKRWAARRAVGNAAGMRGG